MTSFLELQAYTLVAQNVLQLQEHALVAQLIILELQAYTLVARDALQLQALTLVAVDICKTPLTRAAVPPGGI